MFAVWGIFTPLDPDCCGVSVAVFWIVRPDVLVHITKLPTWTV
jgi:hypothetical protein